MWLILNDLKRGLNNHLRTQFWGLRKDVYVQPALRQSAFQEWLKLGKEIEELNQIRANILANSQTYRHQLFKKKYSNSELGPGLDKGKNGPN